MRACKERCLCILPYLHVDSDIRYHPSFLRDWLHFNQHRLIDIVEDDGWRKYRVSLQYEEANNSSGDSSSSSSSDSSSSSGSKTVTSFNIYSSGEDKQEVVQATISLWPPAATAAAAAAADFRIKQQDDYERQAARSTKYATIAWWNNATTDIQTPQMACVTPYRNYLIHGTVKQWHANGQLKSCCSYVSGLKHGQCVYYFEDGQIHIQGGYQNDSIYGTWLKAYASVKHDVTDCGVVGHSSLPHTCVTNINRRAIAYKNGYEVESWPLPD